MSGLSYSSLRASACGAVLLMAACGGTARGQERAVPLRVQPTVADPRPRPLANEQPGTADAWTVEAEPAEPQSVVPPQFGQPELLPPPAFGLPPDEVLYGPHAGEAWSDQLVHRWLARPWFSHSDPNDPYRHIGLGQPLIGTSWRNRPVFAGAFLGGVLMNDLISNRVDQNDTGFMGLRLGFDFDHYWGLEGRYAFARPELTDGEGVPLADPSRDYFVDVSLVHYPWGDARWRPYVGVGLGFQTFRFKNEAGQRISESLFSVPIGVGVKYFYGPWFTLRFDIADNIAVGNEHLSGMHNVSFMAGAEFRFGGRRQSYYPWHNNTAYW